MDHWHVGCITPKNGGESHVECFADIEQAGWAFRAMLQRAIDALPPDSTVPGSDDQYLVHLEWLEQHPDELLVAELTAQRRLGREVLDGGIQPAWYWVGDAAGNPDDCELQAGGGPR